MNYENILITTENNIATVVINRPTKLNALNKATITEPVSYTHLDVYKRQGMTKLNMK